MAEGDIPTENAAPGGAPVFESGQLKGALKAFKKKMKSTLLDDESGKIGGPTSGGKTSSIVAITPPSQFPREIWEELVRQKRLAYEGHGLYRLLE